MNTKRVIPRPTNMAETAFDSVCGGEGFMGIALAIGLARMSCVETVDYKYIGSNKRVSMDFTFKDGSVLRWNVDDSIGVIGPRSASRIANEKCFRVVKFDLPVTDKLIKSQIDYPGARVHVYLLNGREYHPGCILKLRTPIKREGVWHVRDQGLVPLIGAYESGNGHLIFST